MNEKIKNFIGLSTMTLMLIFAGLSVYLNKEDVHNRMSITRKDIRSVFSVTDAKLLNKVNINCENANEEIQILREKLSKIFLQGPNGEKYSIELDVDCNRDWIDLPPAHISIIDENGKEKDRLNAEAWLANNPVTNPWDVCAQAYNGFILPQDQEWILR